jgi:hypothetical protein
MIIEERLKLFTCVNKLYLIEETPASNVSIERRHQHRMCQPRGDTSIECVNREETPASNVSTEPLNTMAVSAGSKQISYDEEKNDCLC